jgi:hypothetical protein
LQIKWDFKNGSYLDDIEYSGFFALILGLPQEFSREGFAAV